MATILIVDDSSLARRMLLKILEPAGYTVLQARSGMEAIERYFLDKPDLVLLDMTMNEMTGLEVLAKLRELDAGARVVMATADIQQSTRELAASGGARAFVTKPFERAIVLDAVDAVLQGGV
jgi:two-component system, chemotaxis family, chemotaxis protein CheY